MKEKKVKLGKCPFCGGKTDWHTNMLGDYIGVQCLADKCGARVKFAQGWDKETTARKFNERKI